MSTPPAEPPLPSDAIQYWEAVLEDLEATIADYTDKGWTVFEVHPGDVTPVAGESPGEPCGLDVLVPSNELEDLQAMAEGADFDAFDVYRQTKGDVVLLIVAIKSSGSGQAILYPAYYDVDEAREMLQSAAERGRIDSYFRNLADDEGAVFAHGNPALFRPD
jgi:hypothetical protein